MKITIFLFLVFVTAIYGKEEKAKYSRIVKAYAVDSTLFAYGTTIKDKNENGYLLSYDLKTKKIKEIISRGVADIYLDENHLLVLEKDSTKPTHYSVQEYISGSLMERSKFMLDTSQYALLLGKEIVLTNKNLIKFHNGKSSQVPLKGKLGWGVQKQAVSLGDELYVGFNAGEWGGGLKKINLKTGLVKDIERRDGKGICDGPLNKDCDPITGIIAYSDSCIVASIGLIHMMSTGRIIKVCHDKVETIFSQKYPNDSIMTKAFFGVYGFKNHFWTVTTDSIFRFANGNINSFTKPKVENRSGIWINQTIPGLLVLSSDVNWAVSVSGYTPILVPIEKN
jgi:hypothetical protein